MFDTSVGEGSERRSGWVRSLKVLIRRSQLVYQRVFDWASGPRASGHKANRFDSTGDVIVNVRTGTDSCANASPLVVSVVTSVETD